MDNHEKRELERQTQNMIDNQAIMNNRRIVRKAINETLEEANIKPINPNDLLFLHTRHIRQLEQKLVAQEKHMHVLEERLTFAEQIARESHSVVEQQPKFQEMLDNANKANREAQDLAKLCLTLAKKMKK
jgi:formate dehydrogenase maturation protein FdhE